MRRRWAAVPSSRLWAPASMPTVMPSAPMTWTRPSLSSGPAFERRRSEGRPALDIPQGVRVALERAGVDLVADAGVCTACSSDHWSWRARQDRAPGNGGVAPMNDLLTGADGRGHASWRRRPARRRPPWPPSWRRCGTGSRLPGATRPGSRWSRSPKDSASAAIRRGRAPPASPTSERTTPRSSWPRSAPSARGPLAFPGPRPAQQGGGPGGHGRPVAQRRPPGDRRGHRPTPTRRASPGPGQRHRRDVEARMPARGRRRPGGEAAGASPRRSRLDDDRPVRATRIGPGGVSPGGPTGSTTRCPGTLNGYDQRSRGGDPGGRDDHSNRSRPLRSA